MAKVADSKKLYGTDYGTRELAKELDKALARIATLETKVAALEGDGEA